MTLTGCVSEPSKFLLKIVSSRLSFTEKWPHLTELPVSVNNPSMSFFKHGTAGPSQQCKRASNSIQDPPPHWILTIFKLKFGGGNLFSPAMTSTIEEIITLGATVEEGDPRSGAGRIDPYTRPHNKNATFGNCLFLEI
jgi:hypothetical protein